MWAHRPPEMFMRWDPAMHGDGQQGLPLDAPKRSSFYAAPDIRTPLHGLLLIYKATIRWHPCFAGRLVGRHR
jgi:hypothetical protein